MPLWPLPGGTVSDPASDQNFRSLAEEGGALEDEVDAIKEEGLPPTGKVGGVLSGELPNPGFAKEPAYEADLEDEEAERAAADKAEKEAREAADAVLTAADKAEKEAREAADAKRVEGPAAAVDLDIAVFNGTTGKIVKDGGKTVAQVLDRANHTGTQLAATVSDFDTQVRKSSLNQMTAPTADLSINTHKLTNVSDPTAALDAANKEYVDAAAAAAAAGLSVKSPVAYATAAALTVTAEAEKTLEGDCPLTVDGTTPPPMNARVLVKNQASEKRNGIYEVTKDECIGGEGTIGGEGKIGEGSKWVLTRTADADAESEVQQGMFVLVTLGATNANTTWILTTANPIVIGTTAQTFAAFTAAPIGAAGGDLTGTYPNPQIAAGTIVNVDVNAAAAIAYSKLNLAASILTSDLGAGNRNYGLVTALPTEPAPAKGDQCSYYADKTNGVVWNLIYDGEGEYPWKKIGGPPLWKEDIEQRKTASTTFQTTGAPSITAPLKMEFRARFGASQVFKNAAAGLEAARNALFINGVESSQTLQQNFNAQFLGAPMYGVSLPLIVAKGQAIQNRYTTALGTEVEWYRLFIEIDPIRVG